MLYRLYLPSVNQTDPNVCILLSRFDLKTRESWTVRWPPFSSDSAAAFQCKYTVASYMNATLNWVCFRFLQSGYGFLMNGSGDFQKDRSLGWFDNFVLKSTRIFLSKQRFPIRKRNLRYSYNGLIEL